MLLAGHIVIRRLAPHADPVLTPVAAMINLMGLVMIHRLDIADQLRAEANDRQVPAPTPSPRPRGCSWRWRCSR